VPLGDYFYDASHDRFAGCLASADGQRRPSQGRANMISHMAVQNDRSGAV
jgi:hypothetical protein